MYILGTQSRGIVISKSLYEKHHSVKQFLFSVTAVTEVGTPNPQIGAASLNVFMNTLPHGGTCNITPKHVSSSSVPFYVTCENWQDDNTIKLYEIFG